MVLPHQAWIEERVQEVVGDLRRQGAGARDVHRDRTHLGIDRLAVKDAVRRVIDHACGRRGGAPGELRIDDDAQEIAVQLADEAIDVGLVGPLGAQHGELRERERLREHVDGRPIAVLHLGHAVRDRVVGVVAHALLP